MKYFNILLIFALSIFDSSFSASTAKRKSESGEPIIACPYHACTAEMLGCEQLAINENGCTLCECVGEATTTSPNKGICQLLPDAGRCRGNLIRYYFNRATNKCEPFVYGGCNGNDNNFETIEECSANCENSKIPCPLHACTPENLNCPTGTGLAKNENGCDLCECEAAPVPCPLHSCTAEMLGCSGALAKNENGCELCECEEELVPCPLHSCNAEMLGCSGALAKNENGCELCECEAEVITPPPVPASVSETSTVSVSETTTVQNRGICQLLPDAGRCRGNLIRYYFNRATNKCEPFVYGGCHGNDNNFETIEECSANCENNKIPCPLHVCTPENLNCPAGTGLAKNENGCDLCECEAAPAPCPLHSCTAEMLGCFGELATNENGCELCICEAIPGCPLHSCTAEMLGCSGELAKNENGCELCECEEDLVPCPLHSCTAEMLECSGELAKNENGCELCECEEELVPCPLHSCTAEMLGCSGELVKNENGCELCECEVAPIPCPLHSCTAEMLGCSGALAQNDNGCELCECEAEVITPPPVPASLSPTTTEQNRGICLLVPDAGRCKGKHIRYYFNRAANKCEPFVYGGCNGNDNNFETQEDCSSACETSTTSDGPSTPCFAHGCTPEILNCPSGTGLATNDNGCPLCECEVQPVPCPLHSCTAGMLGCPGELAKNENGCELCECEVTPIPCPLHSCTAEMLGCSGELVKNENGCELCECEVAPIPCPLHSCTAEMLECSGALAQNDNGCELCECEVAPIPCPLHSCTAEMLGCSGELAKNDNGCELCECEAEVITPPPVPAALSPTTTEQNKGICLLIPDAGRCRGKHIRYYFNRATNKCEPFVYGGCNGNENNFETQEDCSSACETFTTSDGPPTVCFAHGCTPELLNCPSGTGLVTNENGCPLCECEASVQPVPCPLHSCTAEMLGCSGELAKNENGCKLCECEEELVPCPLHSCTAEMLGCSGELAKNENNCELCECAPIPCPLHSCTAEMLGCSGELVKNENGCELCECEAVVILPTQADSSTQNKGICLLVPDAGRCRGKHIRYYFNRAANKCEPFVYGGCNGNDNNFEAVEECAAACGNTEVITEGVSLIPCPLHSCTAEMLGCSGELAKNENGCDLCECEDIELQ